MSTSIAMAICLKFAALGIGGNCETEAGKLAEYVSFQTRFSARTSLIIRCRDDGCMRQFAAEREGWARIAMPRHRIIIQLTDDNPEEVIGAFTLAAAALDRQ